MPGSPVASLLGRRLPFRVRLHSALSAQLTFRLAWCREHSAVMATELLQPRDLACGTLFQSSCLILTSPTDCNDHSWKDTFFGRREHGVLWLLICSTIEKHFLTYLHTYQVTRLGQSLVFMIAWCISVVTCNLFHGVVEKFYMWVFVCLKVALCICMYSGGDCATSPADVVVGSDESTLWLVQKVPRSLQDEAVD